MFLEVSRRIPLGLAAAAAALLIPALLPAAEADRAAGWAASFDSHPPLSFVYGGRPSAELLPTWRKEVKVAGNRREVSYTDPSTGLVLRAVITVFGDFPAAETVLYFRNGGAADTPILEDVRALDARLPARGRDPVLYYAKGATCSMDDFMPMRRVFNKKGVLHLEPGGGRSSSDFMPFVNIETQGEGTLVGLGWSGEWALDFDRASQGDDIRVRAGMALTHLLLHPGEEIRTPLVLTLFWQGDRRRGQNLLRRFVLAHHRPAAGGVPVRMPVTASHWGGTPASVHLENIRHIAAHKLPFDYYWIDAEWFGNGPWFLNPGNWNVKRDLYPEGFRPISALAQQSGMKMLVWFEPERVSEGTQWASEHPGWLLEVPRGRRVYNWGESQADPRWVVNESLRNQIKENDRLFNLGDPAALRFITEFFSGKIEEFGLGCYRHDANIAPLEFWRAADAPDRQGITEIRWIEGLYAFWDELLRRHPGLIIDNCASGGRRIDLESMSRTLPLWRTDFPATPTARQCHSYGLLQWVPLNATAASSFGPDADYVLRSGMSSGVNFGLFSPGDVSQPPTDYARYPYAEIARRIEQYRGIQKYFDGDFYPLTEYTQAEDAWMAYQLDLPRAGEGLVVALKRPRSSYSDAQFRLEGLDANASYQITDLDSGAARDVPGSELAKSGVAVHLGGKPASALFRYRRLP
jgi:alpha-galactosidase